MKCPCHSGKEYVDCCAPYHKGEPAPTPLALMRSRYSAYALGNVDYIIATTHSENPDRIREGAKWEAQIEQFCNSTPFTGLIILKAEGDTVTFRAELGTYAFTEKSVFAKENGFWRYLKAIDFIAG